MHIRHDWLTGIPWTQKSVRTLCGRTTTYNAATVPFIGPPNERWCTACMRSLQWQLEQKLDDLAQQGYNGGVPGGIDFGHHQQHMYEWLNELQPRVRKFNVRMREREQLRRQQRGL